MIKYKFIYEETDDDANSDLADLATKHIEIVASGKEDMTYDELLPHFRDWLRAIGYPMDGVYFQAVER
jgi:hypothetical protein